MVKVVPQAASRPWPGVRPGGGVTVAGDLVTVLLGAWLIGGVFSDGWAHLNVPGLESFFTPWHGVLYAALMALIGWVGWLALPRVRAGRRGLQAPPVGYRLGAVGLAIFTVGGFGDLVWHQVFGVETGLDALLSPTHLLLLSGGMLILTSPLRSRWSAGAQRSGRASWVAAGSLAVATGLAAFFLVYGSAFTTRAPTEMLTKIPEGAPGHEAGELPAIAGLSAYVVTTVLLVVPVLLLWRRGVHRPGVVTVLVALVAWLSVAVVDFRGATVAGAVGATLGAVLADAALASPVAAAWPERVLVLPALVWSGQLAGFAVVTGLGWPVELWSGVVVLTALVAAALGVLTGRWPTPVDGPPDLPSAGPD
jgi:hypothetical protein